MKTVFAFRGDVAQRNSLHTSLGDELTTLAIGWLDSLSETKPDCRGAIENGRFAWSGSVESLNPTIDGFHVVSVSIWREGDGARIDVQISTRDGQSPFRTLSHKPSIVRDLRSIGQVTVNARPASDRPVVIKIGQAKQFAERLVSPKRDYPLVVVSATPDGRSAVRPTDLAVALEGLAHVAHVQSSPVSDQIEKTLGAKLAVKEGEVRIYWPGLTRESSGTLHRLFRENTEGSGVSIEVIYEAIGRVIAGQYRPDPRIAEFIAAHAGTWPAVPPEAAVRPTAVVAAKDPVESATAKPEIDLELEITHLQAQLADQARRIQSMERDAFDASERIRLAAHVDRFSMDSVHQFALITEVLAVQTMADLVALFESHVPDSAIVFLPEAHASARKSPYSGGLLGPARLLQAVCGVATRYHFGNLHEGEDFKRAFQAAGEATFAADSSASTLAKYRAKYARIYDDGTGTQSVLLRPHVSFGSGRAHSSVKVYWHVDERNRRFVVGQIGEHLPIASRL